MAQGANIKSVIENLCLLLTANGASKMNPEYFRQAKYDENQATRPMWILNYEVMNMVANESRISSERANENNLVTFVKSAYFQLDYRCKDFYSLPNDMSYGSRELLIAFGWFIAQYEVFEVLETRLETPIFDLLTGHEDSSFGLRDEAFTQCHVGDLDRLIALQRKCKHEMKIIKQMYRYFVRLMIKLKTNIEEQSLTTLRSPSVLSFILSECKKDKITMLMKLLEKEKTLIKCYIKWFPNEHLLWKWLSSVIEEKKKYFSQFQTIFNNEESTINMTHTFSTRANISSWHKIDLHEKIKEELTHHRVQKPCANLTFTLKELSTIELFSLEKAVPIGSKQKSGSENSIQTLCDILKIIKNENINSVSSDSFNSIREDILKDAIHLPMPKR
eukprot:gene8251-9133_t